MADIQIAPTTQAQLQAVLDQTRATFEEHRARFPRVFPETTLFKLEEIHRDAVDLAGDHPTSFSALAREQHVGFALLRPIQDAGMIYDIGVFPEARRQGIGHALLAHAISIARERKWRMLYASVWQGNTASHRLFNAVGFAAQRKLLPGLEKFISAHRHTTYYIDFKQGQRN